MESEVQQAPCPHNEPLSKQAVRLVQAPPATRAASPGLDFAARDLEQGLDS
jgi:hypothetical protein